MSNQQPKFKIMKTGSAKNQAVKNAKARLQAALAAHAIAVNAKKEIIEAKKELKLKHEAAIATAKETKQEIVSARQELSKSKDEARIRAHQAWMLSRAKAGWSGNAEHFETITARAQPSEERH